MCVCVRVCDVCTQSNSQLRMYRCERKRKRERIRKLHSFVCKSLKRAMLIKLSNQQRAR